MDCHWARALVGFASEERRERFTPQLLSCMPLTGYLSPSTAAIAKGALSTVLFLTLS